jgi:hypothetical protein
MCVFDGNDGTAKRRQGRVHLDLSDWAGVDFAAGY